MNTNLINHVSNELLEKLPDINHKYIESEHPDHHWDLLEVKDQIVADLGCGFHMMEPGWDTTPGYFLKKGAKKIIGVDPEYNDIEFFKKTYNSSDFYCDLVNTTEKIENYIINNNVSSLKMDIEGSESLFLNSTKKFECLKYVAIETHDKSLLNSFIVKLMDLNFKIDTICTFYPRVYNICNLIYAHR